MAEAKAFKMIPHCTKDTIQYEMDELVMCKDCKNKEKDGISEGFHYCNINGLQVTDEWFCADGKRRDG